MRKKRIKLGPEAPVAYYHCISRVVDRNHRIGETEREYFLRILYQYARFCQIRVLTYCILSNHFHILIEVPRRPATPPRDEELFKQMEALYTPRAIDALREKWKLCSRNPHDLAQLRESLLRRMWDLSHFMKCVKQRFSHWYNRRTGRKGTLWEERFRSILVEGAGQVLSTMAAYIDLNPVRAGLVEDPKDYRWCGFAAAVADVPTRAETLVQVLPPGRQDLAEYRKLLYAHGEVEGVSGGSHIVRRGLTRADVERVWAEGGKLNRAQLIRCRVRYFSDGLALGSRLFVEQVFLQFRDRFSARRKDGARKLRGIEAGDLYSLRDLRVDVIG